MSQATLLDRIRECQALRDATGGQERTRYGYELLGLQVAGGLQAPLEASALATIDRAMKAAYERGRDDGASILKVQKLMEGA
jgi:hypothetical protein